MMKFSVKHATDSRAFVCIVYEDNRIPPPSSHAVQILRLARRPSRCAPDVHPMCARCARETGPMCTGRAPNMCPVCTRYGPMCTRCAPDTGPMCTARAPDVHAVTLRAVTEARVCAINTR